MLVLDWRHPSIACGSLGNIVSVAYATEYIRDILGHDVGVIPSEWHQDVWKLCIPLNRVFTEAPKADTRLIVPIYPHQDTGWIRNSVIDAGFDMPLDYKVNPRICWVHGRNTKRILLYPREYHNQNHYFNLDYWQTISKLFLGKGWSIVAMLDEAPSHRDGVDSLDWCNEFRNRVSTVATFPPTLEGLQSACSLCELSFGIFSGASWVLLKSTIKQIIISDPTIDHGSLRATRDCSQIEKQVFHSIGNSLDWLGQL